MAQGRAKRFKGLLVALVVTLAAPFSVAPAQDLPDAILVLDQEEMFTQSAFGIRLQAELDAATEALASENRQIEARLTEEELQLTQDRQTMPIEEFRELARDFDERVEAIRAAQDAKGRALNQQVELARQRFFETVFPILLDIARDRNAAAILDSRSILLSAETADITEIAVARIDAALGDGGERSLLEPAPSPDQAPETQEPTQTRP